MLKNQKVNTKKATLWKSIDIHKSHENLENHKIIYNNICRYSSMNLFTVRLRSGEIEYKYNRWLKRVFLFFLWMEELQDLLIMNVNIDINI